MAVRFAVCVECGHELGEVVPGLRWDGSWGCLRESDGGPSREPARCPCGSFKIVARNVTGTFVLSPDE